MGCSHRALNKSILGSLLRLSCLVALTALFDFRGPAKGWADAPTVLPTQIRALVPGPAGWTGFTLLPPTSTGVFFTNLLTDAESAANRVLENGSGVAIGDFDRDGQLDIFLCSLTGRNALFRNLGGWRFENVTGVSGLGATPLICRGAVFADVDGDGWPDLLVSTLGQGVRYYSNTGKGRFEDVTETSGLRSRAGSMTVALADVDGNGSLDLYVANYRTEDIRDRSRIDVQRVNGRMQLAPGLQGRLLLTKDGVFEFGEPDALYLNDGRGRFQLVAWTDGTFRDEDGKPLAGPPGDWGLSASFRDVNGDGAPDLYVCNDYWTPDRFWINNGKGQFGAAPSSALGHISENSMGVDFADVDRDGHTDFLVLDMLSRDPALRRRQSLAQTRNAPTPTGPPWPPQYMCNTLFHNRGDGSFAEIASFAGVFASDWSWQPVFLDVDLDGWEDLIIAAGHRRDLQDMDATVAIQALQHSWPKGMNAQAHQEAFTREMMNHARLYPRLDMPLITFRNRGHSSFQETTSEWGTSQAGVHQGIAVGDLDGDGDLDFVVNNLNGLCGVYRNDSAAPRLAVRLIGLPPNTAAAGARVILRGGAVPYQSQEISVGGKYLSGSDTLLAFAPGTAKEMQLEIRWRSGRETIVAPVAPNHLYEISEPSSLPLASPPQTQAPLGLFEDVSDRIHHSHRQTPFDDFVRQPLLPKRLSELGPGAAWFDLDGDGLDDLIIGGGRGGRLAIFHCFPDGTFQRSLSLSNAPANDRGQMGLAALQDVRGTSVLFAGSSNYEDGLATSPGVLAYDANGRLATPSFPGAADCTGPLALADLDGDGDLDLFVGGRMIPGRYPELASSRIFRQREGRWDLDTTNAPTLRSVGLVSAAVWSDLDGDHWPELVLACDWGPILLFKNDRGTLKNVTGSYGMADAKGVWNGVTTGDVDGDGRLDIVASNWGQNSRDVATRNDPLRLYYGDLMDRGVIDVIETETDLQRGIVAPRQRLEPLSAALPPLREVFHSFQAFSEADITQVLRVARKAPAFLDVTTLSSTIFLNRGDHFERLELPSEAQWSPGFSVHVADLNGDGHEDIFLTQNFFGVPWHVPRQDAGRGLVLLGRGAGRVEAVPVGEAGISVFGDQRGAALSDFDRDGRVDLVITQNNGPTKLFRNRGAQPGLRVRLRGSPGNSQGVGAVIQLQFADRIGPAREIHAGSGYWSQDSAVQVMATPQPPTGLIVRWPCHHSTTNSVPDDAREVLVTQSGTIQRLR